MGGVASGQDAYEKIRAGANNLYQLCIYKIMECFVYLNFRAVTNNWSGWGSLR